MKYLAPVTNRLDRRGFMRLVGTGALAVAGGAFVVPKNASAGIGWCRADPLITVNGRTGHVYVESADTMRAARNGKIKVEIYVPVGSDYSAVPLDYGFGSGYKMTFVEDPGLRNKGKFSEVWVNVYAPAKNAGLPVRVIFHSDDKTFWDSIVEGNANEWIATDVLKI